MNQDDQEMTRKLRIATEALEDLVRYIPYRDCDKCGAYEIASIALKEMNQTKWPYQKLEDAVVAIIKKHIPGPTWAGIDKAQPELDALFFEAGWGDEEYHWESIRHHNVTPTCACWNIAPENKGQNPLPI